MKGVYVIVRGFVQGVGFRAYVLRIARLLGLTGYVRNLPSGEVEIHAEGEDEKINDFLNRVRRGPGRVDDIKIEFLTPTGKFSSFEIRY